MMGDDDRGKYEKDLYWKLCCGSCDDSGVCGDKVLDQIFYRLDTKTKACTIVDKKPKSKTLKIVGDATYRTQAEAVRYALIMRL